MKPTEAEAWKMLESTGAVAEGHFVYKLMNMHGFAYIDKDRFPLVGAFNYCQILEAEADKAVDEGLGDLLSGIKKVALVVPAYGAIKQGLPLAAQIERRTGTRVIVFETEVERDGDGKRYHVIPENMREMVGGLPIIGADDITNNGKTNEELKPLIKKVLDSELIAFLATVDRGGQTAESLGLRGYFPYLRIQMDQHDCKIGPCPKCLAGVPINTDLGKGRIWVDKFGQPPYPSDMNFSAIWANEA